jgi:hypothetical protein
MPGSHALLKSQLESLFAQEPTSHSQAAIGWEAAFATYMAAYPTAPGGPAAGPPPVLTGSLTAAFASFVGGAGVGSIISAACAAALSASVTPAGQSMAPVGAALGAVMPGLLGPALAATPSNADSHSSRAQAIADAVHAAFSSVAGTPSVPSPIFPNPPTFILPS